MFRSSSLQYKQRTITDYSTVHKQILAVGHLYCFTRIYCTSTVDDSIQSRTMSSSPDGRMIKVSRTVIMSRLGVTASSVLFIGLLYGLYSLQTVCDYSFIIVLCMYIQYPCMGHEQFDTLARLDELLTSNHLVVL